MHGMVVVVMVVLMDHRRSCHSRLLIVVIQRGVLVVHLSGILGRIRLCLRHTLDVLDQLAYPCLGHPLQAARGALDFGGEALADHL